MTNIAFLYVTKFHNTAHFRGAIASKDGSSLRLRDIRIDEGLAHKGFVWDSEGMEGGEGRLRFFATRLFPGSFDFSSININFEFERDTGIEVISFNAEEALRRVIGPKYTVPQTFAGLVKKEQPRTMLDIGGRARSGTSRKGIYPGVDIKVADILDAPDVDFVADVHDLSRRVPGPFDSFMSIATFEHLLMPWKAAVEINRVLSPGGFGMVVTHQTVGMHELPWDFFRFSAESYKGIFNEMTGFEILDAGMTIPVSIVPRKWEARFDNTENATGYMTSGVVVRKIGDPSVDWDVDTKKIIDSVYPH